MIYLGEFSVGDTVRYAANFHNDTGTIEDPTSPEAQLCDPSGTWSALTTPTKQNSKTGFYGGSITTTAYATGQYLIRLAGTVATAKTVATVFAFTVVDNSGMLALSSTVEGTLTVGDIWRIMLAFVAGKSSGGGTTTHAFRDQADTKNRISATVDALGNRTATSVDGT